MSAPVWCWPGGVKNALCNKVPLPAPGALPSACTMHHRCAYADSAHTPAAAWRCAGWLRPFRGDGLQAGAGHVVGDASPSLLLLASLQRCRLDGVAR